MSRQALATKATVEGGATAILRNQAAWFMGEMARHGSRGLTKADYPGLHVGDLVMRIRRKLGEEVIVTQMEPNKHGWGGEHGRYRLNVKVTLEDMPILKKQKPSGKRALNQNTVEIRKGSFDAPSLS